jgi:hypothetical protein
MQPGQDHLRPAQLPGERLHGLLLTVNQEGLFRPARGALLKQ